MMPNEDLSFGCLAVSAKAEEMGKAPIWAQGQLSGLH